MLKTSIHYLPSIDRQQEVGEVFESTNTFWSSRFELRFFFISCGSLAVAVFTSVNISQLKQNRSK